MTIITRGLLGPLLITRGYSGAVLGIREAIYAYLAGRSDLAALVGDRIFFSVADRGAAYPLLTFDMPHAKGFAGRRYGRNLSGADGTSTTHVKFTAISTREADCVPIVRLLAALDEFAGMLSGVTILSSQLEWEFDASTRDPADPNQWIHEVAVEYRIRHRATPATA